MRKVHAQLTGIAAAVVLSYGLAGSLRAAAAQPAPSGLVLRPTYQLAKLPVVEPATPNWGGLEQAVAFVPGARACRELTLAAPPQLTLLGAIEHVLCRSPVLSQALLLVDEQRAGVDLSRSAYRPRFSVSAELATDHGTSRNTSADSLRSSADGSLGVSWLLFDGGVRSANVEQSHQLLNAANAGRNTAVLNAVNDALRLYIDAAAARARLAAVREAETVAGQSLQVVQAKHDAHVASLAEKLQAETALAQATLDRVRAEGVWETARGVLAVSMGFPVDEPLTLASVSSAFPASSLPGLAAIAAALQQHPRMRGARADVLVLKARLDSIRAEDKGNVLVTLGAGSTRELGVSHSRFEPRLRGNVAVSIPIFNQAEQQARESQVLAQMASREAAMALIEREIAADIWRGVKLLETEAQNLKAASKLLDAATQSHQITFGRYKAGVGSILELISTQVALAAARSQSDQAQLGHALARLRLEVASGHMVLPK